MELLESQSNTVIESENFINPEYLLIFSEV
jgi:hypothetical protein